MAKQKSIDYILGMITGASIMIAQWESGYSCGQYHPGSKSCE